MFYSHTLENNKLSLFYLFLKSLLKGDESYRKDVDKVIRETTSLIKGEKDFYTIDRDGYPVIVYLKKSDSKFFEELDTSSLQKEHYEHITRIFEKQAVINLA